MFRYHVHFEDRWDRYVATYADCGAGYTPLDAREALRVLLYVFDAGELDREILGVEIGDFEWNLRCKLEEGLKVHRLLTRAERRAARAAAEQVVPAPSAERAQVVVEVVAGGQPLAGAAIEIIAPDGSRHSLQSGPEGSALLEGIPPGTCRVRLPRHDASAWRGLGGAAKLAERRPAHRHVVVSGECLSTIAHNHGHTRWQQLWEYADNAALRARRESPHVLHPGDVVMVPGLQIAELACATNATHRIEVELPTLELKVTLADHLGRPFANQPYRLWCDDCSGEPHLTGTTTGAGLVEARLPQGTWVAYVLLDRQGLPFTFQLSAVPQLPKSWEELTRADVIAIQARLNAIGVGAGAACGTLNAATQRALQVMRRARGDASEATVGASDLEALRAFGV